MISSQIKNVFMPFEIYLFIFYLGLMFRQNKKFRHVISSFLWCFSLKDTFNGDKKIKQLFLLQQLGSDEKKNVFQIKQKFEIFLCWEFGVFASFKPK